MLEGSLCFGVTSWELAIIKEIHLVLLSCDCTPRLCAFKLAKYVMYILPLEILELEVLECLVNAFFGDSISDDFLLYYVVEVHDDRVVG